MTPIEKAHPHEGPRTWPGRAVIWGLATCVLAPLLVFGAAWVGYKKPWLMNDYRAGYAAGEADLGVVKGPDASADVCSELMGSAYAIEPRYVQYDTPEPASAYWWGCTRALYGGPSDWWNVSGYLTA